METIDINVKGKHMQTKKNIIISFVVLLTSYSCSNMNDPHLKYLDEGEIIYAAKVDSVSSHAGNNRLKLEVFIKSQRVAFVRVYWNTYKDSIDINIENQTGTFDIILDNMPESEYLFQLVSFDKFNNKSLPFEAVGSSLGENFRRILPNRRIETIIVKDNSILELKWNYATENSIYSIISYIDSIGKAQEIKVYPHEMITNIIDWKQGSVAICKTVYLPNENAIDIFTSNSSEIILP